MPHIQRLRAFCALVAAGPEGLTPSVLADQLDVARNSLSFYLKELVHGRSKSHGCVRTARALGYVRLITYTLPDEGGASLRAAGWRLVGLRGGGNWNRARRPRSDTPEALRTPKLLWEAQ